MTEYVLMFDYDKENKGHFIKSENNRVPKQLDELVQRLRDYQVYASVDCFDNNDMFILFDDNDNLLDTIHRISYATKKDVAFIGTIQPTWKEYIAFALTVWENDDNLQMWSSKDILLRIDYNGQWDDDTELESEDYVRKLKNANIEADDGVWEDYHDGGEELWGRYTLIDGNNRPKILLVMAWLRTTFNKDVIYVGKRYHSSDEVYDTLALTEWGEHTIRSR